MAPWQVDSDRRHHLHEPGSTVPAAEENRDAGETKPRPISQFDHAQNRRWTTEDANMPRLQYSPLQHGHGFPPTLAPSSHQHCALSHDYVATTPTTISMASASPQQVNHPPAPRTDHAPFTAFPPFGGPVLPSTSTSSAWSPTGESLLSNDPAVPTVSAATPRSLTARPKDQKRRTKTGCLTCRKRRIKVSDS
jgi:hypothetical protein